MSDSIFTAVHNGVLCDDEGQMKQYTGVKIVQAEPEAKGGVQGYKVVYLEPDKPDYASWRPAGVFERRNRETSAMPFSLALETARKEAKVSRRERETAAFREGNFLTCFGSTVCAAFGSS
ncbi:MAG: hypothetical protein LBD13_02700 [Spirochaetaceae bacterium]|jgi:hypothetical protein|nr:hypothetical protein [Spirochaetaceae bacterium]